MNVEEEGKTLVSQKDTRGGTTKFEKLYNTIEHQIEGLSTDKGLECNPGYAQSLLKYFDDFATEKARLERINKEQEDLKKKAGGLENEKNELSDDARLTSICRRLKVSESINKNYDVRRIMWLGVVLPEFLTKLEGEEDLRMKYISSPIFLELFTNIVAPFANDGNLKIALDIFDQNRSAEDAKGIYEFYQSLLNKNFDNINLDDIEKEINKDSDNVKDKIDINNVLMNTAQLCVLIVLTKLNHHANALSKDLGLISSLTLDKVTPAKLAQIFIGNKTANKLEDSAKSHAANNNTEQKNILENMLQDIAEGFFSKNPTTKAIFEHLKNHNPMSEGIHGDHFNTGTALFTTFNAIMRGATVAVDYKAHDGNDQNSMSNKVLGFLGDNSIRRAKEEIARLGEGVNKEVGEKFIYEYLEMLRAGLNGRNYSPPQEPGDLPTTSLNTCHVQKLSKDYKGHHEVHFLQA